MPENKNIMADVIRWMEEQITAGDYRDVSVSLSLHTGRIAKITKTITEKLNTKTEHEKTKLNIE